MRQVAKEEFYKVVGPLNVHAQIQNSRWPYTSLWKMQDYRNNGQIVGKTVDVVPEGKALAVKEYYLN
jgi:hypothetical protein